MWIAPDYNCAPRCIPFIRDAGDFTEGTYIVISLPTIGQILPIKLKLSIGQRDDILLWVRYITV